jgi:hypothetical protein
MGRRAMYKKRTFFKHSMSTTYMHTFKFETNDKTLTTSSPISDQHRSCRNITPLTAADTPGPGHNFQSQSPGHEAFGGPRAEAAGRKRGLRLPRPGRRLGNIGPWAGGVGLRAKNPKNKVFSLVFQKKKIEQRFRRPHGIGFPTVMSTIFSTRKGSVMTIKGERGFFWG